MLTEQQLQIRKTGLGGSDVAAALGYSKFKSPLDVYLDKTGHEVEQIDNDAIWWGNNLEDLIIQFYERRTGNIVEKDETVYRHPDNNWMLANIDGWVNNREFILECKSTHSFTKGQWGDEYTADIPVYYLCQCAWYAAILDKPKVELAAFAGTQAFRIYEYKRDHDFETMLIEAASNFWHNNVLKQIPPEPVNNTDLFHLYPEGSDNAIVTSDEILQKYKYLVETKKSIDIMNKEKEDLELEIKKFMGDSGVLQDPSGSTLLTYKNTKPRKSFDSKRFKIDNPDLYSQYVTEGKSNRMFLIKSLQKDENNI